MIIFLQEMSEFLIFVLLEMTQEFKLESEKL